MPIFNGLIISEAQLAEAGYTRNSSTVNKMPPKPKFGRTKPEVGKQYFVLAANGGIEEETWWEDFPGKIAPKKVLLLLAHQL